MTEDDEVKSLDRVVTELGQRFPGVPRTVVERTVADRYRQFDGAPVRDYIPVMVKRSAKASLASMVSDSRTTFGRNF
jgi:predicted metalloprotease with PDZ domain